MRLKVISALLLFCGLAPAFPQASPYSNSVFTPQIFTSTGQTGATIQLNGLITPSTVGSSFSSLVLTVTGTSLTTATFQVLGSSNNGGTFAPLLVSSVANPGSPNTTTTVTGPGLYQVNAVGLTHVKIVTSGTFTATNLTITITASPNAQITKNSGGGGGAVASVFGRTGTVGAQSGDYSFSQLSGSPSASQIAGAGTLANTAANANAVDGVTISGTPTAGAVAVATGSSAAPWRRLTQDDILPGFSITAFNGGATVEIGATVTNPAFTASYSSTPASASITNTDGVDSPLTLSTPFTSGTVVGNFSKTSAATTTFTLTAISSTTQTASVSISWLPRTFDGIGAASATSSITASGSTAVLSNGAVLANAGLNNASTYGPLSPSGQKIYILMVGGSHTFRDASTGFLFAFNTPTSVSFVNQNGATVAMYLYESTNTLTGTFSIQVVS